MFDKKCSYEKTRPFNDKLLRPTLNTSRTAVRELFTKYTQVWDAIPHLRNHIENNGDLLPYNEYDEIAENIWVPVSAYLAPTCKIEAPAIICGGAKICHYAHVEGSVIGAFATVGEMSHVKNSIMLDRSAIGERSSLFTSVTGYESSIGEGCIVADTRLDNLAVSVTMPDGIYVTGKERLGGIICDGVKVGASCIINPGTVIDAYSKVYPLSSVSGYVYPYSTVK